jgi:hypothetical protein
VLPLEDPARAEEVSSDSGIPERLLPEHEAVVRQTHRRASVIVVDVPEDRQLALRRALEAAGFIARPPKPVYALLNESLALLQVAPVWKGGFGGDGSTSVSSTPAQIVIRISGIASSRIATSRKAEPTTKSVTARTSPASSPVRARSVVASRRRRHS